jgi:hypothetical protein
MSSRIKQFVKLDWIYWLLIGIFVLLVLLPVSPANMPVAPRDSGVFLYSGWRLVNGGIPYKDVWDQKPPVIFFVNALGLLLSGNSRWGVWGLEVLSLFLAGILSFKLLNKLFGRLAAILTVFLWMFNLVFILDGGNYTTEYALPLQFACFWLAWEVETKDSYRWRSFLIGFLSGILFFTKQNTIGIFIAILVYFVFARVLTGKWKEMLSIVLSMLGGFLLVVGLVVCLFLFWGAIQDFWSAAFFYNFIYSAEPKLSDHLQSLYRGWLLLSRTNLVWFGFLGWSVAVFTLLIHKLKKIKSTFLPVLVIGVMDLPIELGLVSLGGRLIDHYFITLLPVFSLFTAFFFSVFFQGISAWSAGLSPRMVNSILVLALLVALPAVYVKEIKDYVDLTSSYKIDASRSADVINFIEQHTSPHDTVLVMDAEAYINFASQRLSPSEYVYLYPLNTQGYTTVEMVSTFLNAVLNNPPRLIVDEVGNGIRPENFSVSSAQIIDRISKIQANYALIDQIGPWKIYEYSGK